MYFEIFPADFAVFRVFLGISRDFAGPRPREISEALTVTETKELHIIGQLYRPMHLKQHMSQTTRL